MQHDLETIFIKIIALQSGKISPADQEELEAWRNSSSDNEQTYQQAITLLGYADRLGRMKAIDTEAKLSILRKRINQPTAGRKLFLSLQRIAAILTIPLLIFSLLSIYQYASKQKSELSVANKQTETAFGLRTQLTLSDGSKVWLNSGSKLVYPETFMGNTREVELTGEAYFEVQADKDHPFIVNTGTINVRATGTKFNITNYPNEDHVEVLLTSGIVDLVSAKSTNQQAICQLSLNEMAIYTKDANSINLRKVDPSKHLAWIQGRLVFRNDSMANVVTRLGRWYNCDIVLEGEKLTGYTYTATFESETIGQILELLKHSAPIDYKIIPRAKNNDNTFNRQQIVIKNIEGRKKNSN